jgi:hypothetical protein
MLLYDIGEMQVEHVIFYIGPQMMLEGPSTKTMDKIHGFCKSGPGSYKRKR